MNIADGLQRATLPVAGGDIKKTLASIASNPMASQELSPSERLHDCLRSLSSPNVSSTAKCQGAKDLRLMLEQTEDKRRADSVKPKVLPPLLHAQTILDAYIYLPASKRFALDEDAELFDAKTEKEEDADERTRCSGIRLPALHEFNKTFKRGYGFLIWIRPFAAAHVSDERMPPAEVESCFAEGKEKSNSLPHSTPIPQTLFRVATLDNRTFLQCTLSNWVIDNNTGLGTAKMILSIGGTAQNVPGGGAGLGNTSSAARRTRSSRIQQPTPTSQPLPIHVASGTITLSTSGNDWQLLSISHSNPYLKRPRFIITLSGDPILDAECPYPLIQDPIDPKFAVSHAASPWFHDPSYSSQLGTRMDMDEVILLHNIHIPIICGGCAVLQEPLTNEPVAVLGELGPCTSSMMAHPPPVPLNRDAATVSVNPLQRYSLGMIDSVRSNYLEHRKMAPSGQPSNAGGGPTANNSQRLPLEFSRIGIPSCKEGIRGAEIIQLLRSKMVFEFHPWDAPYFRDRMLHPDTPPILSPSRSNQRTVIPPSFVCAKSGITENVRLGLVEPNPGSFHVLQASVSSKHGSTLSGLVLLGRGCVVGNSDLIPEYWRNNTFKIRGCLNLVPTHTAVNSLSMCILPFRFALPSLGEQYYDAKTRAKMQQTQERILATLLRNEGELCGEILQLIGSLLRSSGEIREEAVQAGFIYALTSLLRRVIRRGHWCGILSYTTKTSIAVTVPTLDEKGRSAKAKPSDFSSVDVARNAIDGPVYPVPPPVVHGALAIVTACCGGIYKYHRPTRRGSGISSASVDHPVVKESSSTAAASSSLSLRRTSDLALQCLHGFCFQGCLWGASSNSSSKLYSNWNAAAAMLAAVTSRYCPTKIISITQNPYGGFLRNHMSVQTLLDMIQWYFALPDGPSTNLSSPEAQLKSDIISCARSLTTILWNLLHASLADATETGISRSEHDIQACVAALTSTSLGSFTADVILNALHGILAKCTVNTPMHWYAYPDFAAELSLEDTITAVTSVANSRAQQQHRDQMAHRLARNMNAAEVASVVCPTLLSRIISCGAVTADLTPMNVRSTKTQDAAVKSDALDTVRSSCDSFDNSPIRGGEKTLSLLDWRVQWRRTLLLWVWLLNSPRTSDGSTSTYSSTVPNASDKTTKRTCSLLLASAKTGALDGCVSIDVVDRLLPLAGSMMGSPSSDVNTADAGGYVSMERVKLILPLVPALVVSLLPSSAGLNSSACCNADDTENETSTEFRAALLYKFVYALKYSIQSALEMALHQFHQGVRASSLGGRSSPTYGDFYSGWSNLSLISPGKRLLGFSQRSVEILVQILFLLQPHAQPGNVPSEVRVHEDVLFEDDGAEKDHLGRSGCYHTSSSMHNLLSTPPTVLFHQIYHLIQGFLGSILCSVMQSISAGNSGGGEQPSIAIWKSVVSSLPAVEHGKRDDIGNVSHMNQCGSGDDDTSQVSEEIAGAQSVAVLTTRCHVRFLCDLASIVIARFCGSEEILTTASKAQKVDSGYSSGDTSSSPESWSKEVCISLTRLATLIQEKSLLQPSDSPQGSFDQSQLKLINQILHVLEIGREQMGWCQLSAVTRTLPPPPSSVFAPSTDTSAEASTDMKSSENTRNSSGGFSIPKVRITSASAPLDHSDPGSYQVLGEHQLFSAPSSSGVLEHTSKHYQPFLRPFLNFAIQSIGYIPGTSVELWDYMMRELKATLTAALVGLSFPCARDVGIGALCACRHALRKLDEEGNDVGARVCVKLILLVVEELRERHVSERRARKVRSNDRLFISEGVSNSADNELDSDEDSRAFIVEDILLGSNLFPSPHKSRLDKATVSSKSRTTKRESSAPTQIEAVAVIDEDAGNNRIRNDDTMIKSLEISDRQHDHTKQNASDSSIMDDFIMYTDALTPETTELSNLPEILQRSGTAELQWSNYAGFYSALEKCRDRLDVTKSGALGSSPEGHGDGGLASDGDHLCSDAIAALSILKIYLDVWDEHVRRESTFDLVELFEVSTSESIDGIQQMTGLKSLPQSRDGAADGSNNLSLYANIVAQFIELATAERFRLSDCRNVVLPAVVHSSDAAAEHLCNLYHQHMSIARDECNETPELHGERAMGDGGKDVYSRLSSFPTHRHFPRYVPPYLDHSKANAPAEGTEDSSQVERTIANEDTTPTPPCVPFGSDPTSFASSAIVEHRIHSAPRNSILEDDILKVATHVKIVDITKTIINEPSSDEGDEDTSNGNNEVTLGNEVDLGKSEEGEGGGLDLGFVDRSSFMNRASSGVDVDCTQTNTESDDIDDKATYEYPQDAETAATSSLRSHTENVYFSQQTPALPFVDASVNQEGPVHPLVFSTTTSFALPPAVSLGTGQPVECYWDNVLHVRAEGSRKATLLVTGTQMILEYESDLYEGEELALLESYAGNVGFVNAGTGSFDDTGDDSSQYDGVLSRSNEDLALRPKMLRWAIAEMSQIFLRRYRLRDSALEIFFVPSGGSEGSVPSVSVFLDFGAGQVGNARRDSAGTAVMKRAPHQCIKQWPERSAYFVHEHRHRLTSAWVEGRLSNFDYLLHLNTLAGRTFNDLCQYPVMPWVLSNYFSEQTPDLTDRTNFRDLTKPMGALNPSRLEDFIERFETFQDPTIPPFMYGSHYSTSAGVVLHFLVRLHPFAGLHRQLQNGHFDVADRLFSSVPRTWEGCTGSSAAEVKELTPEWYCCPTFLRNTNNFKLGTSQEGAVLGNVVLPAWANDSPERFVEVMRAALESDICSEMLPDWIDLIFGYKQQGPEAVKSHNVFFYLTYYGSVDVASIEDEGLRTATELQIAHFGQCPMQLFWKPHPRKHLDRPKVGFAELLGLDWANRFSSDQSLANNDESVAKAELTNKVYPFMSAPLSHWVHLDAPPPKSHASLIAVRLAGIDRILTVDSHGIFHCFRWTWKADPPPVNDATIIGEEPWVVPKASADSIFDKGCFVAQRELPHFRAVPRLPHVSTDTRKRVVVALSKTLFASRTLLLALSDGDGKGGIAMQFIDPAKGLVKGETIVPCVHSERITTISMDPLGVATGGGAGGELAIVGSADGSASLWRFISSHYLPLRPRQRLRGHTGTAIHAVAINSSMNVCATVSSHRCCIFNLGNGALLRSFAPPKNPCPELIDSSNSEVTSEFVETPALCFSILGYIILVCKSIVKQTRFKENVGGNRETVSNQVIITLQLFSLEGVHCGSKALETLRGVPHKIIATFDGRAVLVSRNGGVSIHLVSPTSPLELIDEWSIAEDDKNMSTFDVDIGPSLFRPVVAAAACSGGALRLHALPGISAWSEANKKGSMSSAVGNAFAKPAQKLKKAGGIVKGIGSSIVGFGKELGKEALSDVKERGVTGFLGGVFAKGIGNR